MPKQYMSICICVYNTEHYVKLILVNYGTYASFVNVSLWILSTSAPGGSLSKESMPRVPSPEGVKQ